MKLQDISVHRTESGIDIEDAPSGSGEAQHSQEVIELLKARTSNQLFNCVLLAGDEMELANHTIAKLYSDACYHPSTTVLQAIRAINAKLALCNASGDRSSASPNSQQEVAPGADLRFAAA